MKNSPTAVTWWQIGEQLKGTVQQKFLHLHFSGIGSSQATLLGI
jgi:hypothetical protein